MQNILSRLLPGYRFCPTEEQLICYYLYQKVRGGLPSEAATMIKDYNLDGGEEPWEIFNKLAGHKEGDNALYFFTTLGKKTLNCTKRMSRTVGTNGGTWHGGSVDVVKSRRDNRDIVIGTRRRFLYQNHRRPDQHGRWILMQYGSESISENVVICKLKISSDHGLKESRKRKSMDYSSEVIQRNINIDAAISSGPTMAQLTHQEPRQIIQNQEMWPLVGTVSIEDNGGSSATGDTFYSIQNMGHEAPAIVNIEPALRFQPQQANFIQEPTISEHQQMAFASFSDNQKVLQSEAVFDGYERSQNIVESFYEHPITSFEPLTPLAEESIIIENEEIMGLATFSTEDYFENAAATVNVEPTTANENQQMALASYNGDEGVCRAGDNAVTTEDAAPAVSAIPVMDAGLIEYLKNETNWFANF
jgi:hypothetical protein